VTHVNFFILYNFMKLCQRSGLGVVDAYRKMSTYDVTRLTSASKKAVSRLLVDAGQAASWYQDRVFRNLNL
jgi:hypothetical protein